MKITVLDKSAIKYNNHYLVEHQTYDDIDDTTAEDLVKNGLAKKAAEEIASVSYQTAPLSQQTPKFDKIKNGGYVAEAVLTDAQKKALEEKGKIETADGKVVEKDETPVVGEDKTLPKDNTPEPKEQTEIVDEKGEKLSDEEVKAREAQVSAGAPADKLPTAEEANKSGEQVS